MSNWIGYFYYKNILVLVKPSDILSFFFINTFEMKDIYYLKHIRYIRDLTDEFMEVEYHYIHNEFIPGYKFLCQKASPYYYKIKEGDTWEKITEDYGITLESLLLLNKRIKIKKPPKKGISIRVY